MKISMLMPTRGKPHVAAAIVNAGNFLASGEHEIVWVLGIDDDDPTILPLYGAFPDSRSILFTEAPRARALGMIFNRCAAAAPADTDIYCQFVDDGVIASVDWDKIMVAAISQWDPRIGVVSWQASDNPGNMGNPCFTRQWYEAAGFYTEHFPFWFDDTWLAEVFSFTTGTLVPILPDLRIVCRKSLTRRMRDLRFWTEFYAAMRVDRLLKAEELRRRLDIVIPAERIAAMVKVWEARDRMMLNRADRVQAALGRAGDNEETPLYREARSAALVELAPRDMSLFGRWDRHFRDA